MRSPIAHLPDSELAVMQVFWRAGKPLTRPEIDAGLAGQKNWTVSTVVALLIRLENRGFVSHEKQGRGYLYRPLVTPVSYTHLALPGGGQALPGHCHRRLVH